MLHVFDFPGKNLLMTHGAHIGLRIVGVLHSPDQAIQFEDSGNHVLRRFTHVHAVLAPEGRTQFLDVRVPSAGPVVVIPVAPAAGAHTTRAASATAPPTPAPATRASTARAPSASASPSPSPTSACIMLSRQMRSLPFLTRREHPAALSTARAFHPRLNDSRGHQLLTRDVRPHAAMYHPIVRPRKHESSSTPRQGRAQGS